MSPLRGEKLILDRRVNEMLAILPVKTVHNNALNNVQRLLDCSGRLCCLLQSATNVFVVCLAVSDLMLCMFSLPVQLHYQLTDNWFFGDALCRVVFAAFAVPVHLSTVTVMLIAVDRFDTTTISIIMRPSLLKAALRVKPRPSVCPSVHLSFRQFRAHC